jgi:hypothetical protein
MSVRTFLLYASALLFKLNTKSIISSDQWKALPMDAGSIARVAVILTKLVLRSDALTLSGGRAARVHKALDRLTCEAFATSEELIKEGVPILHMWGLGRTWVRVFLFDKRAGKIE